jgi:HPt (histidine-containing phosphotransfer) domain-containing protein
MTRTHIDLQVLEDTWTASPTAITSLGAALAPIARALGEGDLHALQACGHRAKSTALHIGAQDFADTCQALEEAARLGQAVQALALAHQLQQSLPVLEQALHQAVQQRLAGG